MYLHLPHHLLLLLGLCLSTLGAHNSERFDESLTLNPLRDGKISARFAFTTLLANAAPRAPSTPNDVPQHYTLFPLSLGQILREYAITELHFTLNAGRWNYARWGLPTAPAEGVGTGAELWAWMAEEGGTGKVEEGKGVDARWKGLQNALAGLFCSGLAAMDDRRTTAPGLAFQPLGALPRTNASGGYGMRHATLPYEHVCTENLTPFTKLLPCTGRSGLAQLLNPHKLFDADWHGMGVHVLWKKGEGIEVKLTFQAVLDPVRISKDGKRDWSIKSLFDRTVTRTCPVASTSKVLVSMPNVPDAPYAIQPDSHKLVDRDLVEYAVDGPLDISMRWPFEQSFQYPLSIEPVTPSPFTAHRRLTTTSQAEGRLTLTLTNHRAEALSLLYTETMPWLVTFFLHTLKLKVDGAPVRDEEVWRLVEYMPSAEGRPTLLQAALTVPPRATLRVEMDVAKAFLKYTDHMPDAQRGWDLPHAVLQPVPLSATGVGSNWTTNDRTYVYTPALLVDLATPDFSMPYNVIIMSCMVVALVFGMIFNMLTRAFVVVDVDVPPPREEGADGEPGR